MLKDTFIGRLAWTPVSVQFSNILSKLEEHRKLLDLEISNASTEETLNFYAKVEKKLFNDIGQETEPSDDKADKKKKEIGQYRLYSLTEFVTGY